MRRLFALAVLCAAAISGQVPDARVFSGDWRLDASQSQIRSRFDVPTELLRVEQNNSEMIVTSGEYRLVYPLAPRSRASTAGELTFSVATKWEGDALLANIIVSGAAQYSISERWVRSRDGARLTITRTILDHGSEVESTLVYNPASAAPSSRSESLKLRPEPHPSEFAVAPGTRVLLRLTNSINTKHSAPGDRIYLQTAAPVFLNGRLVIPRGSYVTGTITESKEAGRVKGKSELNFRFDTLTLPNGVTRDLQSRADSVDGSGKPDAEGRIKGEGSIGKDAGTVAKTTAGGTGVGSIVGAAAGNLGMGAGIGAAAGAVGGLAKVFGTRGKEIVIPPGTTVEMVLDRELRFSEAELPRR
jgi:hypothetical protein